jgi:hypothetical protein
MKYFLWVVCTVLLGNLFIFQDVQAEDTKVNVKVQTAQSDQAKSDNNDQAIDGQKCDRIQDNFKARTEGIIKRNKKRIEVFEEITSRVQKYNERQDLNVPDYSILTAGVYEGRQDLREAHELSYDGLDSFECEKYSAKVSVLSFKVALMVEILAFNKYKDSLTDLIAAVRTSAEAAEQGY